MSFFRYETIHGVGRNFCAAGSLAMASMLWSSSAAADVTGNFEADGMETVRIEYRDDDHVRMQTPDGSYIVVTGGEGYMVSREGGEWLVYALDDFRQMFESIGIGGPDGADFSAMMDMDESAYQMRDTGRSETIAGIRGNVHEVIMSDGWDEEVTGEVVLTDNRDAVDVYRGMLRITRLMGEMAGQQGMDSLMAGMYGLQDRAILRADDDWRLASIERNAIPSNAFTLPAEPSEIPGMAGLFGGNGNEGQAADIGAAISGWLNQEAENVGRTAGDETRSIADEAEDEARDSVTDSIRRGVRGLFDR